MPCHKGTQQGSQMNRSNYPVFLATVFSLLIVSKLTAGPFRVVALTGVPEPDGGAPFEAFGSISLNNSGQVAFNPWHFPNQFSIDSRGIWISSPGQEPAMVDPPTYHHYDLVLNDAGETSFTNGGALVRGSSLANAKTVAAYNQPAPGVEPPNTSFTNVFNNTGVALNNRNEVAFVGTAGSYDRLYLGDSYNSLKLIASAGQLVDDVGQIRPILGLGGVQLNDAGDLLFNARFQDPVTGANWHYVSYLWTRDQELKRIAGSGDTILTDRGPIQVSTPTSDAQINNEGRVAMIVNSKTLMVSSPQGYKVVVAEDDMIGDERVFYLTNRYAMSGNESVVYEAAMFGGTAVPNDTRMILKGVPGQPPTVVARTLTPAPGAAPGLVFPIYFGNFAVNGLGQVALSSRLQDSVTGELTGYGIWAEDGQGILRTIAQTGDIVDVDNGPGFDLRQISYVSSLSIGGNQTGRASSFNDLGQVALVATFTDGSQAILVSAPTVPEPTALSMVFCGLVPAMFRRQWHRAAK
jgi:hypothetical protein